MCATCHDKTDALFPSNLKLVEKCKDCHGRIENAPAAWVLDRPRTVRIAKVRVAEGAPAAADKVAADCRAALERRKFALAEPGRPAETEIEIEIRIWSLREDRFVARGESVVQADVAVVARPAASGAPEFRRRAVSRPFYGVDRKEAELAAARDAFRVVEGHLAEALKKG